MKCLPAGLRIISAAFGVAAAMLIVAATLFDTETGEFARNADTLLPAAFTWDVTHHSFAWAHFQLPRVPSLAPDILVYGLIQSATGDWRVASFLYGLLSLLSLILLSAWLAHRAGGSFTGSVHAALLPIVGVLVLNWLPGSAVKVAWYSLVPADHSGPFLLSLFAAGLARGELSAPSLPRRAAIGTLTLLGTLSDPLFLTGFVAPLIIALAVTRFGAVRRRLLVLCGAAGAIGLAAAMLLNRQPTPPLLPAEMPHHVLAFLRDAQGFPAVFVLIAASALALLYAAIATGTDASRRFGFAFGGSAGLGAACVMVVLYQDYGAYRYAFPLLWWPVILGAGLLAPAMTDLRSAATSGAVACIAGYFAVGSFCLAWRPPTILVWHSPVERCLSVARDSLGLHAGLAEYWVARPTAASADWRLQVDQISPDGAAYLWGNDPVWYVRGLADEARVPVYDFIVMDRLRPAAVHAAYGPPREVLDCPGSEVWIYGDPATLHARLVAGAAFLDPLMLRMGSGRTFPAAAFIGADGVRDGDALVARTTGQQGKIMTWGPYTALPAGRWRVSVVFRAMPDAGAAFWDIAADAGRTALFTAPEGPADAAPVVRSTILNLPRAARAIEIRTRLTGPGRIILLGAAITRADLPPPALPVSPALP